MLLSIIISNHGRTTETARLVNDIRQRAAFDDYEIIVVDYDNPEVIDLPARVISVTRHPHEGKDGLSLNHMRNVGAKCANGEWLMFLDADLRLSEQTMDSIYRTLLKGDPNVAYGGVRYKLNHAGSIIAIDPPDYTKPKVSLYGFCMIFHRDAFWKLNGFNEGFYGWGGDDMEMMKRAFAMGMESYVIRLAVFKHPLHPECAWRGTAEPNPLNGDYEVDQVTEFELDRDKYIATNRNLQAQIDTMRSDVLQIDELRAKVNELTASLTSLGDELEVLRAAVETKDAEIKAKTARIEQQDSLIKKMESDLGHYQNELKVAVRQACTANEDAKAQAALFYEANERVLELEAMMAGYKDEADQLRGELLERDSAQVSEEPADEPKRGFWARLFGG